MDKLILVDLFDNEIGHSGKSEIHRKGLLHRAFSIFIINNGKMLIQKRAYAKYHSGGLWTNACCSHPRAEENLFASIHRQLEHELNIPQNTCSISESFSFVYFQKYSNNLFEYEYDHVFLAEYSGKLYANKDEIEEIKWVAFDELIDDLQKNPEKYSAWFLIAAPKILSLI